jgi:AP2 domain/HNH endonuclease
MTQEIPLTRGLVAIVDDEDYEAVMAAGKWHAKPRYPQIELCYAYRTFTPETGPRYGRFLHNFLMGTKGVDHRNGNGLDCRRSNLRLASSRQNSRNRGMRADNTSGYKGVSWHRLTGRWIASIKVAERRLHLGLFPTAEDAALAYNVAALEHFGEFARLNEVP